MRLNVLDSRELQATILALRAIDKTLAAQVRKYTKAVAAPEWSQALNRRATTRLEQRVIANTAVVTVTNQNVRVQSASKGRMLSGGLLPKSEYPAVEFGKNPSKTTYTRISPRGQSHRVTAVVGRQFKRRNPRGYVFYPAAEEMIPRIAALWVQTTVKTIANALEGKQE